MSLPLLVNNSLFWNYKGTILSSWYLCGDGSTADHRNAHLKWCTDNGCDTVILNINNEGIMSLWKPGQYMQALDNAKAEIFVNYVKQIHSYGGKVVLAFYDGPPIKNAKYPYLRYMDRHAEFIRIVIAALDEYVAAYLIGCETNRYWSSEIVEQAIAVTKTHTKKPVGTHEQGVGKRNGKWAMTRRIPSNADFHCHETSNHPANGDARSVADMVAEINFLVSQANGVPIWVAEYNINAGGKTSRAQARAMATLPGVYGVGGPI